jgi:ribose transport system permease protein
MNHSPLVSLRRQLSPRNISAVYLLAVILLWAALVVPTIFYTDSTLTAILNNATVVGLVAVALTLPLAAGVYDLSVGNMVAFSGVIAGVLETRTELSLVSVIALTVMAGAGVGLVNAFLIVKVGIDSFIATLGSSTILLGVTTGIANNQQIVGMGEDFLGIAGHSFLGQSLPVFYLALLALVLYFFLDQTPAGRYVYATGGNREAARLAGVATGRYITLSLVTCSAIAAFAGIVQTSIVGLASKDVGPQFLLPAFAAAFLGATQFKGGRFNVWGTLVVIVTLATGVKVLELWTQRFWLNQVFYGVVLLIAVSMALYEGRIRLRRRRTLPVGDELPDPESASATAKAEV